MSDTISASSRHPQGLESCHDLEFQRRWWIFERAGWAAMLLVVALGLSGVLGHGPASRTSAQSADGRIRCEYERWARCESPSQLQLTLPPSNVARDISVAVSRSYLDGLRVEGSTPSPRSEAVGEDEIVYRFHLLPSENPARIKFDVRMTIVGTVKGSIRVGDGSPLRFSQFVYP